MTAPTWCSGLLKQRPHEIANSSHAGGYQANSVVTRYHVLFSSEGSKTKDNVQPSGLQANAQMTWIGKLLCNAGVLQEGVSNR